MKNMAKIVLIAADCKSKANYLETLALPDFYMQDFSIQGITVDNFKAARDFVRQAGYTVLDKNGGTDSIFGDTRQLASILTLLQQQGVQAEISDIADTLYQA